MECFLLNIFCPSAERIGAKVKAKWVSIRLLPAGAPVCRQKKSFFFQIG
jgi:hypothetical protein